MRSTDGRARRLRSARYGPTALGCELRLAVGLELIHSQVVRSYHELVDVCMGWRDAMIGKGWE